MKLFAEHLLVAFFFLGMLFIGPGAYLDHHLAHDVPYGYGASDAFQHQTRAQAIKDAGHFRFDPAYISKSLEGIEGRYPPVLYHSAIGLSVASGLAVYDAIYILVLLCCVVACIAMYVLIRTYHKTIGLLSLPPMLLLFYFPASIGLYWGHWPSILAQAFLVLFFWAVSKTTHERSYALIGGSLSIIALTHTSEAVFAGVFLACFFITSILAKTLSKDQVKNIALGIGLALMFASYYLVIFMNTWAKAQPYQFSIQSAWVGNPGFYLFSFGLLLIPLLIGLIIAVSKVSQPPIATIAGLAMLGAGFLNYAGFDVRAFQLRFFWPLYLAIFFGIGLYFLLKPLALKAGSIVNVCALALIALSVSGLISWPVISQTEDYSIPSIPYVKSYGQGMMDAYHWQAFIWLSENTPPHSQIYFFYGDIYGNDALLRNTKRVHAQADPQGFVQKIQERNITPLFLSEIPGDNGGILAKRTGAFSFTDAVSEVPLEYFFGEKNICDFDYFVFDRQSGQQVLAQYNMLLASKIEEQGGQVVFSNELIVIIKNTNTGGECIAQGTF